MLRFILVLLYFFKFLFFSFFLFCFVEGEQKLKDWGELKILMTGGGGLKNFRTGGGLPFSGKVNFAVGGGVSTPLHAMDIPLFNSLFR